MNKPQQLLNILFITCIGFSPVYAATDVFLKLDGVEGEATDPEHSNEIDVLSWSWQIENESKPPSKSTSNKTTPSNGANAMSVVIQKYVDKATTPLMLKCATGKHSQDALLTVRKSDATGAPLHYMFIYMENVKVTSYSISGESESAPIENITLDFTSSNVVYQPQQREDGTTTPAVDFKWSIQSSAPK